jgi:DNA mismatch repair protein MutS
LHVTYYLKSDSYKKKKMSESDPNIFDVYENYSKEYVAKYGQNCVILMQVGMFHEFYGVDNEQEKIGQVKEISELLNIVMTRRNKKILENGRKNFLMAGFPTASLERYTNVLLDYNYTVVIVDQIPKESGSGVTRAVTKVCSPGTTTTQTRADSNFLMSIYFNDEHNKLLTVGLSAIDLSTGNSVIYEAYSTTNDTNLAIDECYRFIQSHNPREILLQSSSSSCNEEQLKEILDLHDYTCHFRLGEIPKDYLKVSYQNEFLGKIFTGIGMLSPIEYLDLEKNQLSVVSYLSLLQFAYEHNEKIVENLDKPSIWESDRHLTLTNNAIQQLNLIQVGAPVASRHSPKSSGKYHSVFGVICHTSTAMGKRLLKERLLNPILHEETLNQRYNYIESLMQGNAYTEVETKLKNIVDLERMKRKISMAMLPYQEFATFDTSIQVIIELVKLIAPKEALQSMIPEGLKKSLKELTARYKSIIITSKYATARSILIR